MRYDVKYTNQFLKDLKIAKKQKKNLDKLFETIDKLARGETLDARYKDHTLTGEYRLYRECHVEADWLLIYHVKEDILVLMVYRIGSHSMLFK